MKQSASQNRTNLGFVLAILILLGVFAFAAVSLEALIESNNLIRNAFIVEEKLGETLLLITDAETSQRGYIITGDEIFLEPYNAASSSNDGVYQHLQELRQLTSDNPSQQKRLDTFESLTAEKLAILKTNIDLRRTSGFEAAQQAVASGQGNRAMQEIRQVSAEMLNEEDSLLEQRTDAASSSLRNVLLSLALGGPLIMLLVSSSFYFLNQQIRERRRAEQALQQLNRELDQRVTERTTELRRNEAMLRQTNQIAKVGGWELDLATMTPHWSEETYRIHEVDPSVSPDLESAINFYAPEARPVISEAVQKAMTEGVSYDLELPFITATGRHIWVRAQGQPEFQDGKCVRLFGAFQDITERKRAEEALRASENMFRVISTNSPDVIFAQDRELKYIWIINPAAPLSADQVIGKTDWDLLPPEEAPHLTELKQKILATGESIRQEVSVFPGGIPRWYDTVYQPLHDETGQVVGVASYARDITERKRAEEALRQSEEQYRSLFEDSPISLWVEDFSRVKQRLDELKKNGVQDIPAYLREHPDFVTELAGHARILDVNNAALKLYHAREKSELLGTVADVFPAMPLEQFENELIQIANGRLNFEREEVDHTLTGEKIHVNVRWSVAPGYEDSLTKVIVSTLDITESKRAEQALREKERLLSESQRIGHIGSWSYDILADTLTYSDEMYRLLDVSPQEFQHNRQGFLGAIYSSDRPLVAKWMDGIRAGRQTGELEFLVFRKNGELRYLRCRGAVDFDKTGKPERFIGTAQDVTERKLAEIQIRQQVERLTALRKIDQAIASSFDLNVTLDVVLSQVVSQLQVDAADVLLLDLERQILEYAAGKGFRTHAIETAPLRIADSQAARERRPVHVENLENKPDERLLTRLGATEGFVCYFGLPLIVKGKVKGVLEIFHRAPLQPYPEWLDFLNTLAGQAAIAIEDAQLFENLERSNQELSQAYDATIEGWSRALDLRDKETEGHTLRVTEMTLNLARAFGLPEEQLLHIRRGGLLHDIGKMGVPDNILLKPGALTEEEWVRMRSHPQYAYDLLKPIAFLTPALDIPYCHHEKWDGTGYPRGLKGEEIPLVARLFAVVDVWDALRSDRSYRPAWTREKTLEHIRSLSGTHFDPQAVEYFLELIKE